MSDFGSDPRWSWRRFQVSADDPFGLGLNADASAASGVEPGLFAWRPTPTGEPGGAQGGALPPPPAATPSVWARPERADVATQAEPRWPWLRSSIDEVPGFRLVPEQPVEPGLFTWPSSSSGMPSITPESAFPDTSAAAPDGWERRAEGNGSAEGDAEPRWPWLRAVPDEVPGFRVNQDGSARTDDPRDVVKLMSGALTPRDAEEQLSSVATNGVSLPEALPLRPSVSPSPLRATAVALPAAAAPAAGAAVDIGALAADAGAKLTGFATRAAPALLGAAPLTALGLMVVPTNTQSETTEISPGLRARVRPGQRSVEIEQRTDNGVLGTGLLATWKTLPVEAYQQVGSDGMPQTVINHEQLNQALGRSAPAGEAKDAGVSEMAQRPKNGAPVKPPPTATGTATGASDVGSRPAEQSLAPSRIDAKVLEEARRRDPEEERLLACRAVRATPGEPAPAVHYDGAGGIETAAGIRVAPGFPAPKGGYDYRPDILRHLHGYKGELELKNRIENSVPYEKIVHYGNPAGDHGPDVLTIGPDGRFMEWDSRSRMTKRRLGPSLASAASLNNIVAERYVWDAIRKRAIAPDVGVTALQELSSGNYNICTVGTGNAYDGFYETVRKHFPTGPRR